MLAFCSSRNLQDHACGLLPIPYTVRDIVYWPAGYILRYRYRKYCSLYYGFTYALYSDISGTDPEMSDDDLVFHRDEFGSIACVLRLISLRDLQFLSHTQVPAW